jgi:hypothetical protein
MATLEFHISVSRELSNCGYKRAVMQKGVNWGLMALCAARP